MRDVSRLTPASVVQWDPEQITTEIDGEVLAMSIRQGVYVGLDPVASNIWRRLSTAQTVEVVCTQLASEYRGNPHIIARDVLDLLNELHGFGMLTEREGEPAASGAAAAGA